MGSYVGKTVALTLCPAENGLTGGAVTISGLFDVEEYYGYEPSAYVWSPFYVVVPHDCDPEDLGVAAYSVDAYVFMEQTEPASFGRQLVLEREMMSEEEKRDMNDRFGNNRTIHNAGFRQ